MTIRKIIKYFLLIANINKIDLCVIGIKNHFICLGIYLIYLIHYYLVFSFGQKHFNIPKRILYMKKLTLDLLIILNKIVMTQKRNLMIVTPNIRFNLIINRTYNTRSPSMKVLTMING